MTIPRIKVASRGMTLVELLVVIAIIALLMGLLIPAVQSVRESARMGQCKNNLRQIALGVSLHEQAQGFLPVLGRGYRFSGDPDLGFNANTQTGGWLYNILPYIEQLPLHQLGAGITPWQEKIKAHGQRVNTPVAMYGCPTRGDTIVRTSPPWTAGAGLSNAAANNLITRSDYGASLPATATGVASGVSGAFTQPSYSHTGAMLVAIEDGLGNVVLCGERYLDPDAYRLPIGPNDQGWSVGADRDTLVGFPLDALYPPPRQDRPGIRWDSHGPPQPYGSPHTDFHVAMCDGSVHALSYLIDTNLFVKLCVIKDGGSLGDAN